MRLELDPFSILRSPAQAHRAVQTISQASETLAQINPGALKRYENFPQALKSIFRIVVAQGLSAYWLRQAEDSRDVIGIGTIISGYSAIHPDGTIVAGRHLDYWLGPDTDDTTHLHAAQLLIQECGRKALLVDGMPFPGTQYGRPSHLIEASNPCFAVIAIEDLPFKFGLINPMQVVGKPDVISVEPKTDLFDIANQGRISQLLRYNQAVTG